MSDKQKLIQEMLEMQKKFIEYERANGVEAEDYFTDTAGAGHPLHHYRQKYAELATKVIDIAHKEKGSQRNM
ncbi:MAG: hypothetical protein OEZ39_10800 [Gammaproteobacteria bacterium]|nr:hypothetical protein [Gammaproteobacteria bacterium]MDH5652332.1 hypothetical protein [Gammaproteobacteria bacterium]